MDFNGLEKPYLLSVHKSHFLLDLIHQVRSHLAGELTLQRSLEGHHKDRLETQLRELREELRGTVQRGDDRFKQLSLEKAELEAANMIMKEQLDDLRASRERETS